MEGSDGLVGEDAASSLDGLPSFVDSAEEAFVSEESAELPLESLASEAWEAIVVAPILNIVI